LTFGPFSVMMNQKERKMPIIVDKFLQEEERKSGIYKVTCGQCKGTCIFHEADCPSCNGSGIFEVFFENGKRK